MSTLEQVREIIAGYTQRPLASVPADGDLVDEFGMDSLDVAEVVTMLEERAHLGDEAWAAFFEWHVLAALAGPEVGLKVTPADIARYVDDVRVGKMPWLNVRGN